MEEIPAPQFDFGAGYYLRNAAHVMEKVAENGIYAGGYGLVTYMGFRLGRPFLASFALLPASIFTAFALCGLRESFRNLRTAMQVYQTGHSSGSFEG